MQEEPIKMRDVTLIVAAIALILAVGIPLLKGETPSFGGIIGKLSPGDWLAESSAKSHCEAAIKVALKSPASASFSSLRVRRSQSAFFVEGLVDAKNGFGAEIRNEFVCDMDKIGDGWKLRRVCLAERC